MGRKQRYCGFCGKAQDEVEQLLAGPCLEVCNECVDMMHKMIHEPKPALPVKLSTGKPRTVIPFRARRS
jgi:ATP-dependent protease Clp ATPase subunit